MYKCQNDNNEECLLKWFACEKKRIDLTLNATKRNFAGQERERERQRGGGEEEWQRIAFNNIKWKFISVLYSQCKFSMLFDVCYCFRLRLFLSSFFAQSAFIVLVLPLSGICPTSMLVFVSIVVAVCFVLMYNDRNRFSMCLCKFVDVQFRSLLCIDRVCWIDWQLQKYI